MRTKSLLSNKDLHPETLPNLGQIPTSPQLQLPTRENAQAVNTTKLRDKAAVPPAHKPPEAEVAPLHNVQPSLQRDNISPEADHLVVTNLGNQAERLVEGQHSPVEIPVIPLSTKTSSGIHLSQIPPRDTR